VKHEKALDDLFTRVLTVLLRKKLVKLERVAHDGMRVRANAGAASFGTERGLQECLEEAKAQVEAVKKEADEPDASVTAREQAARERHARERRKRIEAALRELPKAAEAKKDAEKHEARVTKMADGGFRPAYDVQLATDVDSRAIVGVRVTNVGSDMGELPPMLDDIERRTAQLPEKMLVDGGFASLDAIDDAASRGVTVFAPVQQPKVQGVDPHAPKPNDGPAVAAWRVRMGTDDAKSEYRLRAATAETTNADLRTHRALDRLPVRGLSKVTSVAPWAALAYNVLRLIAAGGLA
jgi:hypothetical protein